MAKLFILPFFLFHFSILFAQDKIVRHNGDTLKVKIVRATETSIEYRFIDEDAEQVIGRVAVKKLIYSSGRTEDITEKIVISGIEDIDKIQVVTDKALVVRFKKGDEIRGKNSGVAGFHTAGSADKKAMKKLLEGAAELGVPVILITSENDARLQSIGIGSAD